MAAKTRRKYCPYWDRETMPDGSASWRLYIGPHARQWCAEVHLSAGGYAVSYVAARIRGALWLAHGYASLRSAMIAPERLMLPAPARMHAARCRRAMLRAGSIPPDIICRAPVWLPRHHDFGTLHLHGGGHEGLVQRWGIGRWLFVTKVLPHRGIAPTRRDAMTAVEQALRLFGHERLQAWDALHAHLAHSDR
jgi:hypothetical protein